jgi:hypothetical protein
MKKLLVKFLIVTAFFSIFTCIAPVLADKPIKIVESEKWDEEWTYHTSWYDYEVSSTFWWRWTEWLYPDGSWKAKYEFKEWSRSIDMDGRPWSWNNNVVRIYNERNGVYIVSEEWGDPWISHQIIKRVQVKGEVKIDVNRYTVSKPPV